MAYYNIGDSFKWFMGRVVELDPTEDPPDQRYLGRVKVRVLHDQTGDLGKKKNLLGIPDDELLWAWPLSSVTSASLSYRKIVELEEFQTPFWIDAVGTSPTGLAVGTYVFGFYLDGHEANIPVIFHTYHKLSMYPEPPTDEPTGEMLQIKPPEGPIYDYMDVSGLAKGWHSDPQRELNHPMGQDLPTDTAPEVGGQILPKHFNKTYTPKGYQKGGMNLVWEPPSDYDTKYPFNFVHTTKSGHAFEIDDTPGHERVQWWHRSGSYEEISNGPPEKNRDGLEGEYPNAMFNGWKEPKDSHDPGKKQKWEGRRVRKTTESEYNIVWGNKETLVNSSLKLEVANNSTSGLGNNQIQTVGNNVFLAVGYYPRTANTKVHTGEAARYQLKDSWDNETAVDNALSSTDKLKQIIPDTHKYDFITDVANNVQLSIGWTWKKARELDTHSQKNHYNEIANNQYTSIGWIPLNNYDKDKEGRGLTEIEKTNYYIDVKNNSLTSIGWKPFDEGRTIVELDSANKYQDVKNNLFINVGYKPQGDDARLITDKDSNNLFIDVKNNYTSVANNNYYIAVGVKPADERKKADADSRSLFIDVANNMTTFVANNDLKRVGGNLSHQVHGDRLDKTEFAHYIDAMVLQVNAKTGTTFISDVSVGTQSDTRNLFVSGKLSVKGAYNGVITDATGKNFQVSGGIIMEA